MVLTDALAYIPLFSCAVITLGIYICLLVIKKKNAFATSYLMFLVTLLFLVVFIVYGIKVIKNQAAYTQTSCLFGLSFFIAAVLIILLCCCSMLCSVKGKAKEEKKVVKINKISKHDVEIEQETAKEITKENENLLETSKSFIQKATECATTENGMSELLNFVNNTVRTQINADGGCILLIDDFEDLIGVKSYEGDFPPPYKLPEDMPHKPIRVSTNFKYATFPLEDNIFADIALSGKAELIENPKNDTRLYENGPEDFLKLGSYIFIPLIVAGRIIGIMAFSRKHGNTPFTQKDLNLACSLSDFASESIQTVITVKETVEHNNLIIESNIATKIQNVLTPAKLPNIKDLQIGTIWNPQEGVCGDYYDVIPARNDRISFVIGDVAGKGTNSVILMSMVRAMIRLVANTKQSSGKIVEWINHEISSESYSNDHFASLALMNYDPVNKEIEIAHGGSTPIYYYDSDTKDVKLLTTFTEPIGVDKKSTYENLLQKTKSGDIIFTYSDGLIESQNESGRQYSVERIIRIIKDNNSSTAKDIANLVKSDVKNFMGGAKVHDDQTLLVIKF